MRSLAAVAEVRKRGSINEAINWSDLLYQLGEKLIGDVYG